MYSGNLVSKLVTIHMDNYNKYGYFWYHPTYVKFSYSVNSYREFVIKYDL